MVISIIYLVGKLALYLKTASWASSIMLHADTDADVDTGLSACGEAVSEHCGPITKWLFLNTHYLSSFYDNLDLQPPQKNSTKNANMVSRTAAIWQPFGNHDRRQANVEMPARPNAKGDTRQPHPAPKEWKLRHATTTPQTTQMGWGHRDSSWVLTPSPTRITICNHSQGDRTGRMHWNPRRGAHISQA